MGTLRRFTVVGVIVTVADVGLFMSLTMAAGWKPWVAELVAVVVATVVSWTLHGVVTFPDDPSERWYRSLWPYASTALGALILGVATVGLLSGVITSRRWYVLLAIKLVALSIAFMFRASRYRHTMFLAIRAEQSHPSRSGQAPGSIRLSVVLPAFNEQDRIAAAVGRVRAELEPAVGRGQLEIVVVDDGSSDETAEAARRGGADQVISHPGNRGKGAAVRSGMLAGNGRTLAFTDADLSYAPAQIAQLMEHVEAGWDVVAGSRKHLDTRTIVKAGRLREVGGRVINLFSAYVLLGRYRDTQCGLKAFRSDVAQLIFSHTRIDGFAFDIEVFALVERYRLALIEVPVSLSNSERSTVRVLRDAARLVRDLFRIRSYARAGLYERGYHSTDGEAGSGISEVEGTEDGGIRTAN